MKKTLKVEAAVDNLETVLSFVEEYLEACGCPPKNMMKIAVAVEEIYVNIASYAYGEEGGSARIDIEDGPASGLISNFSGFSEKGIKPEEPAVCITMIDSGMPYDPLKKKDPDITLPMEERQIGGLGIYMVKQTMDEVRYEYKEGHNTFTMVKMLNI